MSIDEKLLPLAVRQHGLFHYFKDVQAICSPLAKLNIYGFIYIRHYPDNSFINLSNQIVWSSFFMQKYFSGEYAEHDIDDHMFLDNELSLWACNSHNKVWQDGIEYFNFSNGISISKQKTGYKELFCFYAGTQDTFMNDFYLTNLDVLERFCDYFLVKSAGIIKNCESNRLITPEIYLNKKPNSLIGNNIQDFLKDIDLDYAKQYERIKEAKLSKREIECVKSIAEGLSSKIVAGKLHISHRTVEAHIAQARVKLGCKNIAQLVRLLTQFKHLIYV